MEMIEYGGIELDVLVTQRFHRSIVRDEVGNYLMTRWEIEALCNFQPAMISYEQEANTGIPIFTPGQLPGATDQAILTQLLTPRQQLTVTAGGSVVLDTPSNDPNSGSRFPCDAKNGPTCEFVSVPQMIGLRHWIVHVRFVAHTNDCEETQSIVLSNVWTSTIDVDELFYPTRLVAGKAILRTDMMRFQHLTANSFRTAFFFPIDQNYVRENVK